ncbi:MAG TPA: 2Fe-2S iron-sulfur cluster-binding protein [Chryseosolibacter sp.]
MTKKQIIFHVNYRGCTHEVTTHENEYRSLMALLYDKFYFEDFGDCKGIGRCGTCHVRVLTASPALSIRQRNETTTLGRMENVTETSRLSCQILITDAIEQMHFEVIDDDNPGLY